MDLTGKALLIQKSLGGFAISDPFAPVIFVNTADCKEARLFTLIHELTHIWIGKSGISDAKPESKIQTEQLCNSVAAEFLVPANEFLMYWVRKIDNWESNIPTMVTRFHVSRWVIARRALELDLISYEQYGHFINRIQIDYKNRKTKAKGAPPPHLLQPSRICKLLARAVASEAMSERLLLRDASRLMGIKPEKLKSFASRILT